MIERMLEREVAVEVSEGNCGPFLGRATLSDGFALLFPLLSPSSPSCALTPSFLEGGGGEEGAQTGGQSLSSASSHVALAHLLPSLAGGQAPPSQPPVWLEMLTKWNQMKLALAHLLSLSISLGIH